LYRPEEFIRQKRAETSKPKLKYLGFEALDWLRAKV
jgi:hypothetical protein